MILCTEPTMKICHGSIGRGNMSLGDEPLVFGMEFAKAKLILTFQWESALSRLRFHNKPCKNYVSLLLTPSLLLCSLTNKMSSCVQSNATVQEQKRALVACLERGRRLFQVLPFLTALRKKRLFSFLCAFTNLQE